MPIDSATRMSNKDVMKVPQVTAYFWIIKVCCTTVGETLADYLTNHVNWHLPSNGASSRGNLSSQASSSVIIKSSAPDFNMTNSSDSGIDDATNPLNEAVTVGVFGGILINPDSTVLPEAILCCSLLVGCRLHVHRGNTCNRQPYRQPGY